MRYIYYEIFLTCLRVDSSTRWVTSLAADQHAALSIATDPFLMSLSCMRCASPHRSTA